jgi:hypothetical protein
LPQGERRDCRGRLLLHRGRRQGRNAAAAPSGVSRSRFHFFATRIRPGAWDELKQSGSYLHVSDNHNAASCCIWVQLLLKDRFDNIPHAQALRAKVRPAAHLPCAPGTCASAAGRPFSLRNALKLKVRANVRERRIASSRVTPPLKPHGTPTRTTLVVCPCSPRRRQSNLRKACGGQS